MPINQSFGNVLRADSISSADSTDGFVNNGCTTSEGESDNEKNGIVDNPDGNLKILFPKLLLTKPDAGAPKQKNDSPRKRSRDTKSSDVKNGTKSPKKSNVIRANKDFEAIFQDDFGFNIDPLHDFLSFPEILGNDAVPGQLDDHIINLLEKIDWNDESSGSQSPFSPSFSHKYSEDHIPPISLPHHASSFSGLASSSFPNNVVATNTALGAVNPLSMSSFQPTSGIYSEVSNSKVPVPITGQSGDNQSKFLNTQSFQPTFDFQMSTDFGANIVNPGTSSRKFSPKESKNLKRKNKVKSSSSQESVNLGNLEINVAEMSEDGSFDDFSESDSEDFQRFFEDLSHDPSDL